MERSNKHRSRRDHKARKKAPKVPIKTYRWEDIRRARRRGGYPWTHLYKGPFSEKVDPEQFTMDAFRRSKSTSPMGRRSDRMDISEVSSWAEYSGKSTPTLLSELINDPLEKAPKKTSRPSSLVIEEIADDDEDDVQIKEFQMESAESSDNISQYLDREEVAASKSSIEAAKKDETREERAKSAETEARKRKLSVESGHSRYSLSKLGVIKKLQGARHKIKVPKLSFPTKKTVKKRASPPKEEKKKETKKTLEPSRLKKVDKPVYIHIPLKPPPGESDEFSHLEFEPRPAATQETQQTEEPPKPEVVTEEKSEPEQPDNAIVKNKPFSSLERGTRVTTKPPLKINPAFKQLLKDVKELKNKEEPTEELNDDKVEAVQPEEPDLQNTDSSNNPIVNDETLPSKDNLFDELFEASTSRQGTDPDETGNRTVRSKSAEPERKRRSSMDSSYSRKSLSKLAIMKKLKEASEKIKNAFSMDSLRKNKKPVEEQKPKKPKLTSVVKPGQLQAPKKNKEPVYIHIPLKPPEGQKDEFSYLADEPGSSLEGGVKDQRTDSMDSTISVSPTGDGIQLIFLTPPSDDEILDEKEPDIPETPSSSDDMVFFSTLKKLAQDVVDQVSPETKRDELETVREESSSERSSANGAEDKGPTDIAGKTQEGEGELKQEAMVVDAEDGLNETPKAEEQLKSAFKSTESASVKRVSFKRKSKVLKENEHDYEKVEPPEGDTVAVEQKTEVSEVVTPVQAEGLDAAKPAEAESAVNVDLLVKGEEELPKEDKWSKEDGDHEYEPITPPDEEMLVLPPGLPAVTVVDQDSDPKVVISATDILDNPIEEKKKSFFQFDIFHKKGQDDRSRRGSSETQSRSSLAKEEEEKSSESSPNKFQAAFKHRTEQLKTKTNELKNKIHNMHFPKAPEMKKPQVKKINMKKPDLKRFKIEKPKINFHLPKIPDRATIHLPHVSLPGTRRTTETKTIERRQYSTESNADDSEQSTKRHKFDLSFGGTFPRFRKSKKIERQEAFATVPRASKDEKKSAATTASSGSGSGITRIQLHSGSSADAAETLDLEEDEVREDSVDGATKQIIPAVSDYERETQDINRADFLSRWQHGNFKERKDDEPNEEEIIVGQLVEQRFGKGGQGFYENKSETLEERLRRDENRPPYIEDEDEDEEDEEPEFDLGRNKHLVTDLDNLEDETNGQPRDGYTSEDSVSLQRKGRLGKLDINSDEFFVVHEIREGFQTPANALAQMNEYDPIGSNRSLPASITEPKPPAKGERKSIKKPKRRKTPHVSQEEIPGDEESIEELIAPSRPKRRSKRNKSKAVREERILPPYQETINVEVPVPSGQRLDFPRESLGILGDDERDDQEFELERRPELFKQLQAQRAEEPSAPPRRHRSLKSLSQSENESILTDNKYLDDQIILHQRTEAPRRPSRRSRSQTSSISRMSLPPSQRDSDSIFTDEAYLADNQPIPSYLVENQNYKNLEGTSGIPSYLDDPHKQPCVEEPCVQDIRDYMGYSVVDKTKIKDPPLPPPRTPPRRKKRAIEPEQKFATVPRHMGLSQASPTRPLRNYSTLGPVKTAKEPSHYENDIENKENEVNLEQYIEIEDDNNRDLVSGEIIQKMRQRPLPAPPRPPRKPKTSRRSLQDITSRENIITSASTSSKTIQPEEETVSTQTEPLPPDFVCEEVPREPTDTIIMPRVNRQQQQQQQQQAPVVVERFEIYDPRKATSAESRPEIRRELITPSVYSFEETVTHGTLLVQPIDGAKVVPDHQLSRERLVPISKEDDETSEIPESFRRLRSPGSEREVEVLKAEKLQVSDLDVDRLTVNQLLASKLVVSDIDTNSISTNEIQGRSGPIKMSDVELPPQLLEQLLKQLESQTVSDVQKKTPVDQRSSPVELEANINAVEDAQTIPEYLGHSRTNEPAEVGPEPPMPPPRNCTQEEATPNIPPRRKSKQDSPSGTDMLEPEVDDEPPPRPPQPLEGLYFPSQPPASFYALRAKQFVDDNIPMVPRRKRRQSSRSRPVSRSRSTSDDSSALPHRPARSVRRHSEPSIPELSARLVQACGARVNNAIKRLIYHLAENLLRNADGNQDLHVFMVILLVLIAGLILLGYGEDRTVVHLHHWEYFNPPKDI